MDVAQPTGSPLICASRTKLKATVNEAEAPALEISTNRPVISGRVQKVGRTTSG